MFDAFNYDVIRIAALALAILLIGLVLLAVKRGSGRRRDKVHVATEAEIDRLELSGKRADGVIDGVRDRYPDDSHRSDASRLVMVGAGAWLTFAFELLLAALGWWLSRRPGDDDAPPQVVLTGAVRSSASYLLYRFEVEHLGRLTRFRGAQLFTEGRHRAAENVGQAVRVLYLPWDPNVSVIETTI